MPTDARQLLQERVAAIFAEAEEQGFDQRELLPLEVLDNFHNPLQVANNRISALEDGIEEIKKRNLGLEDRLKQGQQAVETIHTPKDVEQLQVQLDLANKSTDFYRKLMSEAEERAIKYQEKWSEAFQKQAAAEEVDKRIERLEVENCDLQQSRTMISEEMRKMKDLYDKLRDKDLAGIVDKEEQLMASERRLEELNIKFKQREEENRAVEGQYHEVMSSLDAAINETTGDLNTARAHARAVEQQKSAIFSEIRPLRKLLGHADDLLNIYQVIFKQLLNTTEPDINVPHDFREIVAARIQAASDEYEAFLTVQAAFRAEGVSETEQSKQLDDVAESAQQMSKNLDLIGEDLTRFLWALSRKPNLSKLIRMKFSVLF